MGFFTTGVSLISTNFFSKFGSSKSGKLFEESITSIVLDPISLFFGVSIIFFFFGFSKTSELLVTEFSII
jgi:hypothetical protein